MADDQQDPKIIKDYLLDAIATFDNALDNRKRNRDERKQTMNMSANNGGTGP